MKTIAANLQTHLDGGVTTLCTCWKITLRDGSTELGFTDSDVDLTIDGLVYESTSAYSASDIDNKEALSVDNVELLGLLDSNGITETDLLGGVYDNAEVEIFLVNYKSLADGVIPLRRGWIGEVSRHNGTFTAELRGLTSALQQRTGEVTTPTCRADLGDSRCGVTLATYTDTGSVTGVTDRATFTDSASTEADDYYNGGLLTWTSGDNNGLEMEIKDYGSGVFTLVEPMRKDISTSDTYSVYRGCDKTATTCKDTFSNLANFRGEPHLPGNDAISEYKRS